VDAFDLDAAVSLRLLYHDRDNIGRLSKQIALEVSKIFQTGDKPESSGGDSGDDLTDDDVL